MTSFTTEEIMTTLFEDMRMSRITKADRDDSLVKILKKQQELIEQNQKKIKEHQELIEHLWAWAEERDEARYDEKTPSEADAEAYLNIMYPIKEEEPKDNDLAPVKYWGEQPLLKDSALRNFNEEKLYDNIEIDYRNFKLYDEYEGEKQGYTYLNDGPQGPGYYGLKLPLQWTPSIY